MLGNLKKYLSKLETFLHDRVFNNFSQLPTYIETPLVKYLPFLSVILGLLCLISAYDLWHAAHTTNTLIGYANTYGALYGVPKVAVDHHMNLAFWLSLIIMLTEVYLFFKAYSPTKKRIKAGWDLIYYAFVLNVAYGLVMLFSYYGGVGTFLERLLFSFLCLYLLFEVRDSYKLPRPKKKSQKAKET